MKSIKAIAFFVIAISMIANIGCKKDPSSTQVNVTQPPLRNTAPRSNAGANQLLYFPINYCTLYGHGYDADNNIRTVLWSKISGPSSFLIEHPDSLTTKLSNLEVGVYQFSLTITDSMGLQGKDTINVTVDAAPTSALSVNAGIDKLVFYPTNFTFLYGSTSGGFQTISWSKISGPPSFFIETPNSIGTKVSNLQIGVYQFEIFFQGNAGLSKRDTCTVVVNQISDTPKEVLFKNQIWVQDGLLWGGEITIKNVYQDLPAGSVFKVYIKKGNSVNWEELLMEEYNSWYMLYLLNGDLHIYSNYDETGTPDVKLVY